MKFLKSTCLLFVLFFLSLSAQEKSLYNPVKMKLQAKNMHILGGVEVTLNSIVVGSIEYSTKDNFFTFGLLGSSTLVKDFREFNYYAKLAKSGFLLTYRDVYNKPDKPAFNYEPSETGHFMDLTLEYQFAESFPLRLLWNTVVFGCDRKTINNKGTIGNQYTTYVEADYPVITGKKVNLKIGTGGTFAFRNPSGIKANFNGETAGIINVYATASRVLKINDYKLPIDLSGIWNPQSQKTYLQITADIVSF